MLPFQIICSLISLAESLKGVKLTGLVDFIHLQDFTRLHDPTRTISFLVCELDGYEFVSVPQNFFFSLGVEDVDMGFVEKTFFFILGTKNSSDGLHHYSR